MEKEYRRQITADTWHSCSNCSKWPTENYLTLREEPVRIRCATRQQLRRFSERVVKENYTETPRPSISATSGCVELAPHLDRRSVSNSKGGRGRNRYAYLRLFQ